MVASTKTWIASICLLILSLSHISQGNSVQKEDAKKDKKAKSRFVVSGDVQYRLRYHFEKGKDALGVGTEEIGDYTNHYAWNFSLQTSVYKNVGFGFRLSNPKGSATDLIDSNLGKVSSTPSKFIAIPEAYFRWQNNRVSLSGGIIPVASNTTLSLAAFETRQYVHAITSWNNYTNGSQTGLNVGFLFVKSKDVSFGMDFLSVIAANNIDESEESPSRALKNDQLRFVLSMPLSLLENKVALLPALHMQTNVYRSPDKKKEEANHSLVGGMDVALKPIKELSFNLGLALGGYRNDCLENFDGYDTLKTAPFGLLTVVKVTVKPGYGKGNVIFKLSSAKDREDPLEVSENMLRWDIKYGFPLNKLTIMPRLRIWYSYNSDTNDESATTKLRPELILRAKF